MKQILGIIIAMLFMPTLRGQSDYLFSLYDRHIALAYTNQTKWTIENIVTDHYFIFK